jgi:RsiW-degrading membrane proteinase PrsW (M82 family)
VVVKPPLVELGLDAAPFLRIQAVERGRALALSFGPDARAPIARERATHPGARIALARGRSLVTTMPIDDALAEPLVVRFGDDITSYTRAYHLQLLLRSPLLPAMHRVSAGPLPPRWGLATACALLPFALSFGWLFFVRRFDRARPEPLWLVLATFALGGLAIVPAALAELGLSMLSPWLDPSLATMGGQLWALPLALAVFTLVVGGAEEGSKFLGAWTLARHRREFDEPVDGIVYGCAAALGFAAVENVKYFAFGRMSGMVIALRAFMSVPAHMFFGAIWGYAMGRALVSRRTRVLGYVALAALAHGAFDALLSTDGMQLFATVLVLALAFAFIAMLRAALRHGAVRPRARFEAEASPATEALPASSLPRAYYRVGSALAFYACATGMIVCAFALTLLGSAYELLHHRVGIVFVVIATVMLGLLGLAAYGASATIPLDVAIDAQGITFAGTRTPWTAITGFDVQLFSGRAFVRLRTSGGMVSLGPADDATAREISASIRAGRGA